ncbi:unnamed protein product [uncultured virus]|nr:unnamed protein product [uncultured virus]
MEEHFLAFLAQAQVKLPVEEVAKTMAPAWAGVRSVGQPTPVEKD